MSEDVPSGTSGAPCPPVDTPKHSSILSLATLLMTTRRNNYKRKMLTFSYPVTAEGHLKISISALTLLRGSANRANVHNTTEDGGSSGKEILSFSHFILAAM